MQQSEFWLTRNAERLRGISLGDHTLQQASPVVVDELKPYGFEIVGREPDAEYGVWIGDVEAGQCPRRDQMPASTIGVARSRFVFWDDALYFEGARGPVWIRICSRGMTGKTTWNERARLLVVVSSGKLSNDRYASMVGQMSGLAAGLVLDLVSKSLRAMRLSLDSPATQVRTSAVELAALERTWPAVAENLQRIVRSPEKRLRRRNATRNCWGSERLDARSIVTLTRFGNDPRHPSAALPFRTQISVIEEGYDTFEHRVIRGFLDLMYRRAHECLDNLDRHIAGLERDRIWRDLPNENRRSLYAVEDIPRLERLHNHRKRVLGLIMQMSRARQSPPLANVRPKMNLEPTPVFSNVEPYRRIRHEMLRFMKSGMVVVEDGEEERVKATGRLYEQWVFLQLVAAFRRAGLPCASQQGILHTSRAFRFTLDLDRGARVTFMTGDGRSIVVKYEPWVLPREMARQNRDSVYRGTAGKAAWSPDILIEFLTDPAEARASVFVEYAVVVDAKYTSAIREHHWKDTAKYLEIRGTANDRQVVKQQWLAYPGVADDIESSIQLRDSTLRWTEGGPDCPHDETVQGTLALAPPSGARSHAADNGWIARPEPEVLAFVSSLLRYMGMGTG